MPKGFPPPSATATPTQKTKKILRYLERPSILGAGISAYFETVSELEGAGVVAGGVSGGGGRGGPP